MTRQEAGVVINKIRNLYITQFGKYSKWEIDAMINTWTDTFKEESLDDVLRAVNVYANQGKPFAPNPPDIINELIRLEEHGDNKLFNRLREAARIAAEGEEHIVLDDLGGLVRDESSPSGFRVIVSEAHVSRAYTQADFANLPRIIQEYAEDISGLLGIYHEIESNPAMARKRFAEAVPYIRANLEGSDESFI